MAALDTDKLRALYEAGARGTWSWEDNPPTLYAGRVDQIGEIGGHPMFGHRADGWPKPWLWSLAGAATALVVMLARGWA